MIARRFQVLLALSLLCGSQRLSAQPAAPAALPPGHPPVSTPAVTLSPAPKTASAAPSSTTQAQKADAPHPAASSKKPEPSAAQGHAPAPSAQAANAPTPAPAPANPHGAGGLPQAPQDESLPATDLPKGSIEVIALDAQGVPKPGAEVHLHINFSRISEGESHKERTARADAEGRARFDGLTASSEYTYQAVIPSGPAEYASTPFNLNDRVGQRLRLHVFQATRDIHSAMIGMRGFVYIEPRDDVFVFDVVYYVFNLGLVTWVPQDVIVRLPEGFKAFSTQAGTSDAGFELVEGVGARLKGTFAPGQENVGFRFQMSNGGTPNAYFRLGALPRTAELRVMAEVSSEKDPETNKPKMTLSVEGFDPPLLGRGKQERRLASTRRIAQGGDDFANGINIALEGIPVPGSGRWIALAIAAALAAVGLASAWGYMRLDPSDDRKDEDLASAKELLLRELVAVERARRAGRLGPRAHADAKRTLLDALARLGSDVLAPRPARKKRRRAA